MGHICHLKVIDYKAHSYEAHKFCNKMNWKVQLLIFKNQCWHQDLNQDTSDLLLLAMNYLPFRDLIVLP